MRIAGATIVVAGGTGFLGRHVSEELERNGAKVFALGSPKGFSGTISEGILSAGLRATEDGSLLQISAPISHG